MKRIIFYCILSIIAYHTQAQSGKVTLPQKTIAISIDQLKDKIRGGWAGQTIGVTFGGPYEFKFSGSFIQDYQPLIWYDGYLKDRMINNPGLYDDLYMDLTFVDVFERLGLDAPVDSFANAFANADYPLWHANQAARYNIRHGILAPQSGHWLNNPHADDIDYQIEADYAGLMSPGLPNAASAISDKIGHIMNYGDGWYGGVYIGALYSIAFTSNDINFVVNEALKVIPEKSDYYQCISDVIRWYKQYPDDWQQTWFELQKKWSSDKFCPDGVFNAFNIDATINSAYVVMGLLYGNGDFGKTLEIATRAGQDADCNPSSAGGILGTMLGYKDLPDYWKMGLKDAEEINFKYTSISLNKVYGISFNHALENIKRNGGRIDGDKIIIPVQQPKAVKYEKSFPDLYPVARRSFNHKIDKEISFDFTGTGFILKGYASKKIDHADEYTFKVALYLDGKNIETISLPTSFTTRRHELCWKYPLPKGKHSIRIKILNPNDDYEITTTEYIAFSDKPLSRRQ